LWSYEIKENHVKENVNKAHMNKVMCKNPIILIFVFYRPITYCKIKSFIDVKYSKYKYKGVENEEDCEKECEFFEN
jgi:hypothetical protein